MTPTDRRDVGLAAKLLAKAESTDSREEAYSLALRAYSLVADWLNAFEGEAGGPRRRERRLLRDRRGILRHLRTHLPGTGAPGPAAHRGSYARHDAAAEPSPGIDLRA